ncbi:MAG TPA: hypothetical protein VGQ03_03870 [Nitrososphaera sp.]|nr:hypothetical protein [Nitrososphaera sp.]
MIRSQRLSNNARKSVAKGLLAAGATMSSYLLIVVLTTPNLPPSAAINAAFLANSIVIGGMAAAVGAQVIFSTYAKSLGCKLDRKGMGAGSGGTAIGSFFSFFSLVPLGCCGSWLLVLSFLPSVFGSALSVYLIEYSRPLSYVAVAVVLGLAALSGVRLVQRVKGK